MPKLIVAAGGSIETSVLPFYLLRLRAQYENLSIRVVLSPGAQQFVTTTAIRGITGCEPYTQNMLFDEMTQLPIHLSIAMADLLALYPSTPRIIAECATGSISCPVTRSFAFFRKDRIIVTPYLHPDLDHRLYLPHLQTLEELGCKVLKPSNDNVCWAAENAWSVTENTIASMLCLTRRAESRTYRASAK